MQSGWPGCIGHSCFVAHRCRAFLVCDSQMQLLQPSLVCFERLLGLAAGVIQTGLPGAELALPQVAFKGSYFRMMLHCTMLSKQGKYVLTV